MVKAEEIHCLMEGNKNMPAIWDDPDGRWTWATAPAHGPQGRLRQDELATKGQAHRLWLLETRLGTAMWQMHCKL
jgi:hypothetical protein